MVIGELAERLVSERTRARLNELLGGRSLAEASVWPDHVRSDPAFRGADNWHFVTATESGAIPQGQDNVVWAIELMTEILAGQQQGYKLSSNVTIDRPIALRFLAHFVGDVHQPLHVGNPWDRGANDCLVKWFGAARRGERYWNLHVLWDEGLPESLSSSRSDLVADLHRRLWAGGHEASLRTRTAKGWAEESAQIRPEVYPQLDAQRPRKERDQPYCNNPAYKDLPGRRESGPKANVIDAKQMRRYEDMILADPDVPHLGYDYRYLHIDRVKEQLLKAAVRLAYLLDTALDRAAAAALPRNAK